VRAFESLTRPGQNRRLRALAIDALRQYDLDVARCSFVDRAFNTVFRADATDGTAHALRVSPSFRIHADGCEIAEAAWLEALRRDADLPVPRVIPARDGSVVVWASSDAVPDARSCVLFEWVRGHQLRDHLRAEPVQRAGALAALVHEHAAGYAGDPPAGVIVADHVIYFGPPHLEDLRPTYGSLLDDAVDRAQHTLDQLWRNPPHRPHLLHGDLQPGNMMLHRNDVVLLDFQDLVWGFDVLDVSIARLAFERLGASGRWAAAFRSGYESVRPWPEADPETASALRAARRLNELNYGITVGLPDLDAFVAQHVTQLAEWMADRTSRSPS
jgi:Ser/Thr protein kinase RdoA (MazF antagonist)